MVAGANADVAGGPDHEALVGHPRARRGDLLANCFQHGGGAYR
jgi:hypothetical protein